MTQFPSERAGRRRPEALHWDISKVPVKTRGEIEAAMCDFIGRFEQEYMGRGPADIRAHLIGDLLVVRLRGVLTAPEQRLVKVLPAEKGRELLKQVRTQLIETARPVLEAMIKEVTGVRVLSPHHDISTVTGEEVILFTLAEPPCCRQPRNDRAVNRGESRRWPRANGIADEPSVRSDNPLSLSRRKTTRRATWPCRGPVDE